MNTQISIFTNPQFGDKAKGAKPWREYQTTSNKK